MDAWKTVLHTVRTSEGPEEATAREEAKARGKSTKGGAFRKQEGEFEGGIATK